MIYWSIVKLTGNDRCVTFHVVEVRLSFFTVNSALYVISVLKVFIARLFSVFFCRDSLQLVYITSLQTINWIMYRHVSSIYIPHKYTVNGLLIKLLFISFVVCCACSDHMIESEVKHNNRINRIYKPRRVSVTEAKRKKNCKPRLFFCPSSRICENQA